MKGPAFIPGTKGTDFRYERAQAKLAQSLSKLPRMSLQKVKIEALHPWISRRLTELVGIEDEVLDEFVSNTLAERQQDHADAGELQLLLVPFMGTGLAETFVKELWLWIEKADASPEGIPSELKDDYDSYKRTREAEEAERLEKRQKMTFLDCKKNNYERRRSRSRSRDQRHRNDRSRGSPPRISSSSRHHRDERDQWRHRSPPRDSLRRSEREPVATVAATPTTHKRSPPSPQSSSYSSEGEDETVLQLQARARKLMDE